MKGIFPRYIAAFSLIILISFLILASIVSVSISEYASDARKNDIHLTGEITSTLIESECMLLPGTSLSTAANEKRTAILSIFHSVAEHAEKTGFLLVSSDGTVLMNYGIHDTVAKTLPLSYLEKVEDVGNYIETGTLGGALKQAHIVCASPINDRSGNRIGALFSCSSTTEADALVSVLNQSIFLSNLWIMLAVMIVVYFITERFLTPIREMTHAAKSFAQGNYDARVTVTGHDEISEFALTFNQMAESLAQSENLRSTFLANVSHDLRTPMTTIAGFIDGILSGAIPPEKHNYYLGVVSDEIHRLSRLVSQLLDISRMETGVQKFTPTDFDICEIARLTLISFEGKIDAKHLDVELLCDDDVMNVHADRDAVHQIVYNLVENAVKFSREGGVLRISIRSVDRAHYEVEVYNEGQGISKEDLPYIFDRFYKTDKSRGLDKVGVGLGLYIVKTMLSANGESIRAESEEGKYCSFIFTLTKAD